MRLMTCSECESMRLIVLVLLHRSASTSNRNRSQQSGSVTVDRIQRSSQDTGSKERPKSKDWGSWMWMRTVDSHQRRNKTEPSTYIQT
ncbi:MAG: hypothetical protein J3Q66DRAFT_350018 [Benniella sp.]|nr:MAG: hypothetical protein J3Q66DRAFT_350018 [Benniella sp.]